MTTGLTHIIVEDTFDKEKCRLIQVLKHHLHMCKINCTLGNNI